MLLPVLLHQSPSGADAFGTAGLEKGEVGGKGRKEKTGKIKQMKSLFVSKTLFLTQ